MAFQRHPKAGERKRSAAVLVKLLLQDIPELLLEHRYEFVKLALWKVTEAEGVSKYKTRLRSKASIGLPNTHLHHDHVWQRANMAKALIQAKPDEVEAILDKAVGCTVTRAEHELLKKFDHLVDGGERYKLASSIVVIDMETGHTLERPEISK
jgi:hypothetical protein